MEAGFSDHFVLGRPLPVRITLRTDRLIQGDLVVTMSGGGTTIVPIEIAGGSTKRVIATVTSQDSEASASTGVRVKLVEQGKTVASGSLHLTPNFDSMLVGVLPGALGGQPPPGTSPLAVDVGTAKFSALTAEVVAAGAAALAPLDAIAATEDDLNRLTKTQRVGLQVWVAQGGQLLVDSATGVALAALPPEWQPGRDGRVSAGLGEIRATGGAMSRGEWSGMVEPNSALTPTSDQFRFGSGSVVRALAAKSGVHGTKLTWLLLFLIVYVLGVGPVLFVALHLRRRAELAWVAIPLAALIFTGGGYWAGQSSRAGVRASHLTVIETGPGSYATSYVGFLSRGGGRAHVQFGDHWVAETIDRQDQQTAITSVVTDQGLRTDQRVGPNTFVSAAGSGPISDVGRLVVTASLGSDLAGTVRNGLSTSLQDVIVLSGGQGTAIGRLAPGQTKGWAIGPGATTGGIRSGRLPAEAQLWGAAPEEAFGFGDGPTSRVPYPAWRASRPSASGSVGDERVATAIGWSESFRDPTRVGGKVSKRGSTAFVGRAHVTGSAANAIRVGFRIAAGSASLTPFSGLFSTGNGSVVVRLALPDADDGPAIDTNRLLLSAPGNVEVWSDGRWQPLTPKSTAPAGSGANTATPPSPPTTIVIDGRTFTVQRSGGSGSFSSFAPGSLGSSGAAGVRDAPLPAGAAAGGLVWVRFTSAGQFSADSVKLKLAP